MNESNKNEVIIRAITETDMTITQAAQRFGVSRQWIHTLLRRYNQEGLAGLTPARNDPTQP